MKGIKYYKILGFEWNYGWHNLGSIFGYYKAMVITQLPFTRRKSDKEKIEIIFRREMEWSKLN